MKSFPNRKYPFPWWFTLFSDIFPVQKICLKSAKPGEAAIAYIHSKSIMHRDIKAQDFIPNGATTIAEVAEAVKPPSRSWAFFFWGGQILFFIFQNPKKTRPYQLFHRTSSMFRCSIPDPAAGYMMQKQHFVPSQAENFLLSDKSPTSVATGFSSKSLVLSRESLVT